MANTPVPVRVGVFGPDLTGNHDGRGCGLWPPGYAAAVNAAGGFPVLLDAPGTGQTWEELITTVHGVVFTGNDTDTIRQVAEGERLCQWCRDNELPLLAVDHGLHVLNLVHGGTLYQDLPRELPEALQHRHPPEKGLRHAINVLPETLLSRFYGEGEIVVNSEHRRAISRVARNFQVSARALDGVVEAIEGTGGWFVLGVQWHPASGSASGLDIQLFRGLVEACQRREAQVSSAA